MAKELFKSPSKSDVEKGTSTTVLAKRLSMAKDKGKSTILKGLAKDLSKFSVKDPGVHTSGLVKRLSKSNVMKGLSKNPSKSPSKSAAMQRKKTEQTDKPRKGVDAQKSNLLETKQPAPQGKSSLELGCKSYNCLLCICC